MKLLFSLIEIKNENQKWESLQDAAYWASTICEGYNLSKDYKSIKIRPFECSETMMLDLINEENFPSKIKQYRLEDILPENNYLHFFIYWNDINRLKYVSFEDVLNFDYKKFINPNVYKAKKKWQYKCHRCSTCEDLYQENCRNQNLNYENYLGQRFFEELENIRKIGNPKDIRICFFIDDILNNEMINIC